MGTDYFQGGSLNTAARRVAARLAENGHQALFAGGAVRDALLGSQPKDIDIATSARPQEVEALFQRTYAVGKAFGVVVVIEDDIQFEVATFRAEAGYSDGRHPDSVTYADAEADAARRDFTINGLFFDPSSDEIFDFVGGSADLTARLVRAIGEPRQRFAEDRLRLMRAVRFASNLGFEIHPETWIALRCEADHLHDVSAERIRDELVGILVGGDPERGLDLLRHCGLLRQFLPEVLEMIDCPQPPQFHPEGDVWTHSLLMLRLMVERAVEHGEAASPELALAVLLHDVGKPGTLQVLDRIRFNGHDSVGARMAGDILRRLRCSGYTVRTVVDLVGSHMRFMAIDRMRPAKRARWLRDPEFSSHLELHALDCLASHGEMDKYEFAVGALADLPPEPLPRLVRGTDLMSMGVPEGPVIGRLLESIADQIEARSVVDRQGALDLAARLVETWKLDRPGGSNPERESDGE